MFKKNLWHEAVYSWSWNNHYTLMFICFIELPAGSFMGILSRQGHRIKWAVMTVNKPFLYILKGLTELLKMP